MFQRSRARRFRKYLGKRWRLVLVSVILAYPIWMWLLLHVYPIHAPLYREIEPDMTTQEEVSRWAWNSWVAMFFLTGHPEIPEAHAELIGAYRQLGRPDLVLMARMFGSILVGWGFSSRVYVLLVFPYLLLEPHMPIRFGVKRIIKFALIMFYLFIFTLTVFTV